jgi:hypothetical protein
MRNKDFLKTIGAGSLMGGIGLLGCFGIILIIPILFLFFSMLTGGFIYLVWNFAIAAAFTLPTITYFWQAIAIGLGCNVLAGLLRGGSR